MSIVDSVFSSPAIGNPNMGFMMNMPFHPFSNIVPKEEGMMEFGMRMTSSKKDDQDELLMDSGSGEVGAPSGGEEQENEGSQEQRNQQPGEQQQQPENGKRRRYHRHTARQIQQMEALFKECPHPDDKQRLKLSQELGLKPRQVKFWFQNRRTQMKAQQDRSDNVALRAHNDNLKNENYRLQAAIQNVVCPSCGSPAVLAEMSLDEQQLRIENARLKDELERLTCLAARYSNSCSVQAMGPPPSMLHPSLDLDMNIYSRHFSNPMMGGNCAEIAQVSYHPQFDNGVFVLDQHKEMALELAITAVSHLIRLCSTNEPLWVQANGGGMIMELLDAEEYRRSFQWPIDLKQGGEFRTEASRDSALIIMNSNTLVDAFLDANKWVELFPSIVSKARTLQVITPGISHHGNGALQLMYAEFQVLSPLVPVREAHFFRYCQQNVEEGTWLIVDFPVEGFCEGLQMFSPQYIRRPSGCIIQDMPNGYAKVMWVEHADVENNAMHLVFNQLVCSGSAFGATRWLSILQRQCERFASLMARNIADIGVISSIESKKNMMMLSQRMVKTFCANISSSNNQSWTALSESPDDTMRVTNRNNEEPGLPNGVTLTAVSTKWLPFSHLQVFDLLTDEHQRSQLDFLSNGGSLHEVAHIANGSHPRNCISLLRMNVSGNSSPTAELLLQESNTHPTGGSFVIYTNIGIEGAQIAIKGEDTSYIPILPTGFVMVPAPPPPNYVSSNVFPENHSSSSSIGCLLTIGMQVVASPVPTAKINLSSITAINNSVVGALHQITSALTCSNQMTSVLSGSNVTSLNSPTGGALPSEVDPTVIATIPFDQA